MVVREVAAGRSTVTGTVPSTVVSHRRRALLRDPNFRLLWAGETVSQVGSAMTVVALPFVAITVLNASPFVLGLLTACAWLPSLLVSLPAGAWVDQVGRKPVMQAANIVSAALLVSVPVAGPADGR
jgi:MFS family permease